MMQGIGATLGSVSFGGRGLTRQITSETDLGAVALVLSVVLGALMLHRLPVAAPRIARVSAVGSPAVASALMVPSNPYGELFDPGFTRSSTPDSLAQPPWLVATLEPVPSPADSAAITPPEDVPLPPKRELSEAPEGAPLPPPRPAELQSPESAPAPVRNSAQPSSRPAVAAAPADNRTIIEKLFGI